MATPEQFGAMVRRLRDERGLTQGQVVQYANARLERDGASLRLTREWLSFVETGRIDRPEPERVEALAAVLGVPAANMLAAAGYRAAPVAFDPEPVDLVRALLAKLEREPDLNLQFKQFDRLTPEQKEQFVRYVLSQSPKRSEAGE